MPKTQSATLGDMVKFICTLEGEVIWRFEGKSLPPNAVAITRYYSRYKTLIINNVGLHNEGMYSCHHVHVNGDSGRQWGRLTVDGK